MTNLVFIFVILVKFLASGLDFTIILHVQQALYARWDSLFYFLLVLVSQYILVQYLNLILIAFFCSLNIILAFGIAQNDISFDWEWRNKHLPIWRSTLLPSFLNTRMLLWTIFRRGLLCDVSWFSLVVFMV